MRLSIIWRTDQGAFHVGKSSGSTRFECKWNAWFDRKFFGTNGRPSEVFHFFRSSWLGPRNSGSICAILFRPAAGTWTFFRLFQCLAVGFDHGLSQFFFSFPVVSFKMASVQNSCELCQGSNFLKRNSNNCRYFHYWQESLSISPGRFPEFPIGNFP